MMKSVARRVVDRNVLRLIKMWLRVRAPIEERDADGTRRMSGGKGNTRGTPHGGEGKIAKEVLGKHTQIVLTDRSDLSSGREFGVMSSGTWRLADLFAKHHFLLNGLGWGGMPLHAVRKDLEEGRLVVLPIEDVPPDGLILPMSVVWQTKSPPGPAGRWFIERLKQTPVSVGKVPKPPVRRKTRNGRSKLKPGARD
jgi:hypothetical protein